MQTLLLLYHLRRMRLAYLPNLVADGEKGDAGDDEDCQYEVEGKRGQIFEEGGVVVKGEKRGTEPCGDDNDDDGTDGEQAQVVFAEEQDDVASMCAVNLAERHFLLTATALEGNGRVDTRYDAEDADDDEQETELAEEFKHTDGLEPLIVEVVNGRFIHISR